ncbi:transcription antitermination factor NusB [Egicoccus sp. AB-alg2]|uniref:transcription antitermination factor NusB n=1 Tax=Egicoccus sp. AB-alg2 TaxID=3242693 RepID=UPI00359D06CB
MADPAPSGPRNPTRRRDTRDPRRARERALKILFQADLRGADPVATLDLVANDPSALAMLDDLDDLGDEQATAEVLRRQAEADASAGTTLDDQRPRVAPIDAFTRRLVLGVSEHRAEIDQLIERYARRWSIRRMPVVDRTVLRVATYELTHEETSPAVVINEAVELAKSLSTEDSGRYVNGVLESVRRHVAGEDVPAEG